jgi:hypothetical protein
MIENHPITPPPELVQQWRKSAPTARDAGATREVWIATQAARWGADQQLNADCEWVQSYAECGDSLLAAMRPKSPRLAEEALKALQNQIDTSFKISSEAQERANTIRAALERLQELEQNND